MRIHTVRAGGCLSYVLVDGGEAAIIDPIRDVARYVALLAEEEAEARWVIDTHTHADHLSGARRLADEVKAQLVMSDRYVAQWRSASAGDALGIGDILRANAGVTVDVAVSGSTVLKLGSTSLRILPTPGHTQDSIVVLTESGLFTGDTLLIGQVGRCDLPGGDVGEMHATLFQRLADLPDETLIYSGHDYQGRAMSVLGLERSSNPFLKRRSAEELAEYMKATFPSLTGAGMQCGATSTSCDVADSAPDPLRDEVAGFMSDYFFGAHHPENLIRSLDLKLEIESGKRLVVLDVREPTEFADGHIPGAYNLSVHTLGARLSEIPAVPHDEIVTVCRSGKRSGWAAMFLRVAGFKRVRSLTGGMLDWQKEELEVAHDVG